MIRIKFRVPETKTWKRWLDDCATATGNLPSTYTPETPIEVSDLYRRKSIKKEVYFAKDGPFRGRCVYCETNITDFQHGDIEHFRPKKGVTDEGDQPVVIPMADGKNMEHPGYYWLAYQWTNLLPSCITCNQPGEEGIGKRNRFPVEGHKYAARAEDVAQEKPLLFNPIDPDDEDPEDHIGIDSKNGKLTVKKGSKRAEACIAIFGLNKRDQLVQDRQTAMEHAKGRCVKLILEEDEETKKELRQEIQRMEQGYLSQTLARRAQIKEVKKRLRW